MWPFRSISARPASSLSGRRPAAFRPRVEGLEDRSVPAAVGFSTALPTTAYGTAVDAAGDTYVTTAIAGTVGGGVSKFDPAGHLLANNPSVSAGGAGIAIDSAGDVYLHRGAVVTELDPTLQRTLFSVTLPGAGTYPNYGSLSGTTNGGAVAVAGGKIYVVGEARAGLPTTANAAQPTYPGAATGRTNAYLAVIDPAAGPTPGYYLTYCTYLGGTSGFSRGDAATGVATDATGAAYVVGLTSSTDFPTTPGAFQTVYKAPIDVEHYYAFVAKIDPSGAGAQSLAYSTLLGGATGRNGYALNKNARSTDESSPSIAVDAAGAAYVAGSTTATDFPTTAGAFQTAYTPVPLIALGYPPCHAFVTKLNPTGTGLVYSTLLEGSGQDGVSGGVVVDAAGDAWVTGWTRSADFPITTGALQSSHSAGADFTSTDKKGNVTGQVLNSDAVAVELNPTGTGLVYSTYWGGSEDDFGMGVGLDGSGNVYVGGQLASPTSTYPTSLYPSTPGAYQTSGGGFLLKFHP